MKESDLLRVMPYPGRLIILGAGPGTERILVVYAITWRSASSQARRLTFEGSAVWTEPLDEETFNRGNADLLIYRAIAIDRMIAVSNGRQTDDIAKALRQAAAADQPEDILAHSLEGWTYEPDAPHFTPRISGCVMTGGAAGLSILRKGENGARLAARYVWTIEPGSGRMIATYAGNEASPLPSFRGEPVEVELVEAGARKTAEAVFEALAPREADKDYRVAVACISALRANLRNYDVHIINRREG